MAVAVIPIGCPSTQIVITLTVEATRRIAWRKFLVTCSSGALMPAP
jgi:hypothetical protein